MMRAKVTALSVTDSPTAGTTRQRRLVSSVNGRNLVVAEVEGSKVSGKIQMGKDGGIHVQVWKGDKPVLDQFIR